MSDPLLIGGDGLAEYYDGRNGGLDTGGIRDAPPLLGTLRIKARAPLKSFERRAIVSGTMRIHSQPRSRAMSVVAISRKFFPGAPCVA